MVQMVTLTLLSFPCPPRLPTRGNLNFEPLSWYRTSSLAERSQKHLSQSQRSQRRPDRFDCLDFEYDLRSVCNPLPVPQFRLFVPCGYKHHFWQFSLLAVFRKLQGTTFPAPYQLRHLFNRLTWMNQNMTYAISEKVSSHAHDITRSTCNMLRQLQCYRQCEPHGYVYNAASQLQRIYERNYIGVSSPLAKSPRHLSVFSPKSSTIQKPACPLPLPLAYLLPPPITLIPLSISYPWPSPLPPLP